MASVGLNVDGYKNVPNYKNLFVAQGKNYLFSPEKVKIPLYSLFYHSNSKNTLFYLMLTQN